MRITQGDYFLKTQSILTRSFEGYLYPFLKNNVKIDENEE